MKEELIGEVVRYLKNSGDALILLKGEIKKGDLLHIRGELKDFYQSVAGITKEGEQLEEAHAGEIVKIRVKEVVNVDDMIFKIT